MADNVPAAPTGGGQPVQIDGDKVIAMVTTISMASELLDDQVLQLVINHLIEREKTAPLNPSLPPDAAHFFRVNRKMLEALRTFKVACKTAREAPILAVPTLLFPGGKS